MKPVRCRNIKYDGELIEVLMPKFRSRIGKRLFGDGKYRLKLDKYGTFVWDLCDGRNRVADIVKTFSDKFNEKDSTQRVEEFLDILEKNGAIRFED